MRFDYKFMKKNQIVIWLGALVVGVGIGLLRIDGVDEVMNFIATVFTRLFRLLAVPTIVLAIITTLASLGGGKEMGRMFRTTLTYTLLTTTAAAAVALGLYLLVAPGNLPAGFVKAEDAVSADTGTKFSYTDHLMSVIPDNIVKPFLDGNVLALLIICFAVGIALSKMPDSQPKRSLMNGLAGLQDLLYMLIHWLIAVLPIGIVAFAAQLTAQVGGGMMLDSLGKYVLVIIAGNCLQFFVVLPLFLLMKGINPIKTLKGMLPAVMMALFTKSSAATLPVTMENAENRVGVDKKVARFVLPICTTVNMNGCAAFILVTSLYVMQNNGMAVGFPMMVVWLLISVLSAFGNAGVPMGCYFLTLSLMAGIGADVSIMGIILPIYTIIDMVETAENVWSDSCVCVITDKTLGHRSDAQA
ncbi:MAG: dicarboxylate/amino acid:cation symporter [Bacteroidales bacterium]|nr:dicarboxylate/amino acid:cation symporter [Bacteroidales bacterium]